MLEKAIKRALEQLGKVFSSKYRTGKAVGGTLAAAAIIAPATYVVKKKLSGGKTEEVILEKQQDIHAHDEYGLNTDGHGHLIAAIYQGDDGHLYKLANNTWYSWNGQEWV